MVPGQAGIVRSGSHRKPRLGGQDEFVPAPLERPSDAKEPLLRLVEQDRIARQIVSGLYLYCASDARTRRQQLQARQVLLESAAPESAGTGSNELRAAIVLFASLLDEKQRRLYAGLESLQLGGDSQIADLLHLDPHTVAKGRRQLLAQEVEVGRVRGVGGGRKPVEKKRPR